VVEGCDCADFTEETTEFYPNQVELHQALEAFGKQFWLIKRSKEWWRRYQADLRDKAGIKIATSPEDKGSTHE
jgi:hypothetical protein